jgi:hypothetical protein
MCKQRQQQVAVSNGVRGSRYDHRHVEQCYMLGCACFGEQVRSGPARQVWLLQPAHPEGFGNSSWACGAFGRHHVHQQCTVAVADRALQVARLAGQQCSFRLPASQYLQVWVFLRTQSEEVPLRLDTAHHRSLSQHPQPVVTLGCCCQHMTMMQVARIESKSDGTEVIGPTSSFDLQSPAWDGPIRRGKCYCCWNTNSRLASCTWT